ncbi:hypothetical protein [Proteiniphilum sp.]|uniref:hypothetical protein n=1 Tax=Proteiniphilum sp. TaxID=1926877 RepID=UPI003318EDBD
MKRHFIVLWILSTVFIHFLTLSTTATLNTDGKTINETDPIDLIGEFRTGDLRSGGMPLLPRYRTMLLWRCSSRMSAI